MFSPRARFFLVLSLLLSLAQQLGAFALNGYHWPTGTEINMHLSLTRPPVNFQDGSASWNASAADALATWNQFVNGVHFAAGPPALPAGEDDQINNVFFSPTIYGDAFPAHVLAITLYFSRSGNDVFSETDVIFNNSLQWDSYRGPLQHAGNVYTSTSTAWLFTNLDTLSAWITPMSIAKASSP